MGAEGIRVDTWHRMSQPFVPYSWCMFREIGCSVVSRVHVRQVIDTMRDRHDERYTRANSRRTCLPPIRFRGPRVEMENYSSRRVSDG